MNKTKQAMSKLGSYGGKATLKKYGKKHYKKMAQISNAKRKELSTDSLQ